jgi:hypothetical protein
MFIAASKHTNDNCQLNYKYPIFCKNFSSMSIVKNGIKMEEDDIVKKKELESIKVVS